MGYLEFAQGTSDANPSLAHEPMRSRDQILAKLR